MGARDLSKTKTRVERKTDARNCSQYRGLATCLDQAQIAVRLKVRVRVRRLEIHDRVGEVSEASVAKTIAAVELSV